MSTEQQKQTYRSIVKSTAIFGGAQLVNAVIGVFRGKFVSILLGVTGMSILAIVYNAIAMIQQVGLMGLNQSAVRSISAKNESGDQEELEQTLKIVRRLLTIAAFIAFIIMILAAPVFSYTSFHRQFDYTWMFLLAAFVVFFNVKLSGEQSILQGLRCYRQYAQSSMAAPLAGLVIGVPIFYFWGRDGIVPSLIISAFITWIVTRWLCHKIEPAHKSTLRITPRLLWKHGRSMIILGLALMLSSVLGTLSNYSIVAFISSFGKLADVGIYQSALNITTQCSTMVFTAMAADYYPQLSARLSKNKQHAFELVNQETEIVLLSIAPVACLLIMFAPTIVSILLTSEFAPVAPLLRCLAVALIFKACCFPMDYIALAKGDTKYFFWTEGVCLNIKMFAIITSFYYFYGIDGLGYAAIVSGVTDLFFSIGLTRWRYGFKLKGANYLWLLGLLTLIAGVYAASFVSNPIVSYAIMGVLTGACCLWAVWQINKRAELIKRVLNKLQRK